MNFDCLNIGYLHHLETGTNNFFSWTLIVTLILLQQEMLKLLICFIEIWTNMIGQFPLCHGCDHIYPTIWIWIFLPSMIVRCLNWWFNIPVKKFMIMKYEWEMKSWWKMRFSLWTFEFWLETIELKMTIWSVKLDL